MRITLILACITVFAAHSIFAAEPSSSCIGLWSASGRQPHVGDAYTADEIPSPNKQYVLSFTEDAVQFSQQGGKPIDIVIPINLSLMEVVWASTSDAFAINVSDGDASGPWKTFVYRLDPSSATPREIGLGQVLAQMSELAGCDGVHPLSVATISWLQQENEFAMAVMVPKSCRSSTSWSMLRIARTGKILETLSGDAFKARWPRAGGCRLQ